MARPKGRKAKQGKKNRKHGRNADCCARYRAEGRQEKNRRRRILRHLRRHPNDKEALRAIEVN
jgi:hypothetical protein